MKPDIGGSVEVTKNQPPSGGCVLKLNLNLKEGISEQPAAFRRLCVETQ